MASTAPQPDANGVITVTPDFAISGQLSAEQVKQVHETGKYKTWINVLGEEEGESYRALVHEASGGQTKFVHQPVTMPDGLNPTTARALEHALHFAETPLLVQCRSSTRASAALALHVADKNAWGSEEVLAWAESLGLNFASQEALRKWVAERADTRKAHVAAMEAVHGESPIFRQLFDRESCTYTYLVACPSTKEGVLIDPVDKLVDRDIQFVQELGIKLKYAMNTHAHADHITGTGILKAKLPGVQSVLSRAAGGVADVLVDHGDTLSFGSLSVTVRATPGHTAGCVSFVLGGGKAVFTGDAMLVRGCGRTDFQGGSSETLYDSIHSQIYTLPDECVVYPAHDYNGRTSSTVGEEKAHNPRLKLANTKEQFVAIMSDLKLARPKLIDVAVPANLQCGLYEVPTEGKAAE